MQFSEFVVAVIFLQTIVHVIQSSIAIYIMYYVFNNPISLDTFWTFAVTMMIIGYQGMFAGKNINVYYTLIFRYYNVSEY